MASLNVVALVGRAGSDPEIKFFESGACKASLNLAVDEFVSGEKRTHWISIVDWGKTAEVLVNYVTKGKQIAVQGSLREDTWEDNGKKRSRLYVNIDRVQLLGGGNQSASTAQDTHVTEEVF